MSGTWDIVRERGELARQMAKEVPAVLSETGLNADDVGQLHQALEKQARSIGRLMENLSDSDAADQALVAAAEHVDKIFSTLAAAAADKMVELRR